MPDRVDVRENTPPAVEVARGRRAEDSRERRRRTRPSSRYHTLIHWMFDSHSADDNTYSMVPSFSPCTGATAPDSLGAFARTFLPAPRCAEGCTVRWASSGP